MPLSFPRPRTLLVVAGAALGAYLAYAAAAPLPATGLAFDPDPGTWRGVFHVHTELSDGSGSLQEVARAARTSGAAWVVVADHNTVSPKPYRMVDGVLMVFAPEISATDGHVTTFGLSRPPTRTERKAPDALANLRRLGGAPVAAHPLGRKRPYKRLDDTALAGLEVLSADQELRDVLAAPHRLFPAVLAYPVNPAYAMARLVKRPDPTFQRWDALLARRTMPGFCAIDAHGFPAYDVMMDLLGMYVVVGRPPTGDADTDGAALVSSLLAGRSHCGVDIYGNAGGFRFGAVTNGRTVGMGDDVALSDTPVLRVDLAYPALPPDAHVVLVCAAQDMAISAVPVPRGRRFEARPRQAGACRAEVRLGPPGDPSARPWIVSNPIYVR